MLRREDLKRQLFACIDLDGDGRLNQDEMRHFAFLVGFEGSDADWQEEYLKLCEEHGVSPTPGITQAIVLKLLDDQSDSGCYCTDEELQQLLDLQGVNFSEGNCSFEEVEAVEEEAMHEAEIVGDSAEAPAWRTASSSTRNGQRRAVKRGKGGGKGSRRSPAGSRRSPSGSRKPPARTNATPWRETAAEGAASLYRPAKRRIWQPVGAPSLESLKKDRVQLSGKRPAEDVRKVMTRGYKVSLLARLAGSRTTLDQARASGKVVFFAGACFETQFSTLKKKFKECGQVVRMRLLKLPDGRSRGMGHVQFMSHAEAQYAADTMWGLVIDDREILVKLDWVASPVASSPVTFDKEQVADAGSGRVFFAGAPFHLAARPLASYFESFGAVQSFVLFRNRGKGARGSSKGMGVCTYASTKPALEALKHGITVEGRPLWLQEDNSERGSHDKAATAMTPHLPVLTSSEKFAGLCGGEPVDDVKPARAIFFKNVPVATTETHLRKLFETAGSLKKLVLFMTHDGQSTGQGVVEYKSEVGAVWAYENLHETSLAGRPMWIDKWPPF